MDAKSVARWLRANSKGIVVRPFGAQLVLDGAWRRLGLEHIFNGASPSERAVFALAAHGAWAGRSTASVLDWVKTDFSIPRVSKNPDNADWHLAVQRLGVPEIWEKIEVNVRARAGTGPTYLFGDPPAADRLSLAVIGNGWPVLLSQWPQQDPRDRPVEVSGDAAPDASDQTDNGYLAAEEVSHHFHDLLARKRQTVLPVPVLSAVAWAVACWLAILLIRQIEEDADTSWADVATELERIHEVTVPLNGQVPVALIRKPTPAQQAILDMYT
jgi:hypothetical protein